MAAMLEKVSRYLPLILLITAIAALLQVALQLGHVFSSQNFGVWLNRNSNLIWWIVAGACFVAWTLVVLAYFATHQPFACMADKMENTHGHP
jgi:hypothetical protein